MKRASLVLLIAAGCVTSSKTEHLRYEPNASNVADAQAEVTRIVEANAHGAKLSLQFEPTYLTVRSKSPSESTQQTMPYGRVTNIGLASQTTDGVTAYAVIATDQNLATFFQWNVDSLADAQRLADALAALALGK